MIGINEFHKKNLVYKDLKPENILIDDNGQIVLIDFGLSRFINNEI